ncbi:MAG: DUF1833 family protein [Minisyncoccia bacterium]
MASAGYAAFFLNSASSVAHLETVEINHPSFLRGNNDSGKTYSIVRNAMYGLTATLETGVSRNFLYYPLALTPTGATDDLDQKIKVSLGDLGDLLSVERDNVVAAGTTGTKPTMTYRVYRSDDLSTPIDGPFTYEIPAIARKRDGASFEAGAPKLNTNQTGEIYSITKFPMLRGFV